MRTATRKSHCSPLLLYVSGQLHVLHFVTQNSLLSFRAQDWEEFPSFSHSLPRLIKVHLMPVVSFVRSLGDLSTGRNN